MAEGKAQLAALSGRLVQVNGYLLEDDGSQGEEYAVEGRVTFGERGRILLADPLDRTTQHRQIPSSMQITSIHLCSLPAYWDSSVQRNLSFLGPNVQQLKTCFEYGTPITVAPRDTRHATITGEFCGVQQNTASQEVVIYRNPKLGLGAILLSDIESISAPEGDANTFGKLADAARVTRSEPEAAQKILRLKESPLHLSPGKQLFPAKDPV